MLCRYFKETTFNYFIKNLTGQGSQPPLFYSSLFPKNNLGRFLLHMLNLPQFLFGNKDRKNVGGCDSRIGLIAMKIRDYGYI